MRNTALFTSIQSAISKEAKSYLLIQLDGIIMNKGKEKVYQKIDGQPDVCVLDHLLPEYISFYCHSILTKRLYCANLKKKIVGGKWFIAVANVLERILTETKLDQKVGVYHGFNIEYAHIKIPPAWYLERIENKQSFKTNFTKFE